MDMRGRTIGLALMAVLAVGFAGCAALSDSPDGTAAGSGGSGSSGSSWWSRITGRGGDRGSGGDQGAMSGGAASPTMEPGRGAAAGGGMPYGMTRVNPREYVSAAELKIDLKDIHFDFDRAEIRPDAARLLDANAEWLKENPRHLVLIEGHADERGTNEYNIALGDRRAKATMNYLVAQGVHASRIAIISYGEERPVCTESTESCWARNRRAHFAVRAR